MNKKLRVSVGPFINWLAYRLPKCAWPENQDWSTAGLGKKQRNFVLAQYGYPSYSAYLQSDLWLSIKAKFDHKQCDCRCGRPATQIHHRVYTEANLLGKTLHGMIALNHGCHYHIEFSEGKKTNLGEANKRLKIKQFEHVADCDPATEEEIGIFLSGRHRLLSDERKQVVRLYLKSRPRK